MSAAMLVPPAPAAGTTLSPTLEHDLIPLVPAVQNYAWGIQPNDAHCVVARMHAYASGALVDATKPYAELWIGTHASGPAVLRSNGKALGGFLATQGKEPTLPYLLKILSVAKPLSIQAHPDKELAEKLHRSNPSAYRDDNHKPEMCVALTDFEGMCNFRPVPEILSNLEALPDLAELVGGKTSLEALRSASTAELKRAALRTVFSSLMSASNDAIAAALGATVKHIKTAQVRSSADELFLRLVGYYPGDVGCFAAYLLNHVRISPGQAFFMAANEPHAYLKGQCVEIMACSDNVVRAGLTPKFKDVSTLVNMLTYNDGPPTIMNGDTIDDFSTVYKPPVEEFQLTKTVVPPGQTYEIAPAKGPGMIMVLGGQGWIGLASNDRNALEARMPLATGSVYYVAESKGLIVQADSAVVAGTPSPDLFFFRASINQD